MREPSIEELRAEFAQTKSDMESLFQNRQLWLLISAILCLWLLPYGIIPFFIGCGMFLAGTRWLKNHALACISEHELFLVASRIQELPEDEQ